MKIYLFLILLIIIPFINAEVQELPSVKLNTCINIPQTCNNCTYVNITKIQIQNNITMDLNIRMTKNGNNYNYTFCNNTIVGVYIVSTCGNPNGINYCYSPPPYTYEVTATGNTVDTSKTFTYILIFIIAFLVFIGLMIFGIFLPTNNKSDEMTGYIIAVSNIKYLKLLSLALAYLDLIFLSYFAYTMSYAYLDMDFVTTIFRFGFTVLLVLLLPLFILGVYLTIANLVRDSKLNEALSRGFHITE